MFGGERGAAAARPRREDWTFAQRARADRARGSTPRSHVGSPDAAGAAPSRVSTKGVPGWLRLHAGSTGGGCAVQRMPWPIGEVVAEHLQ